MVNVLFAVCRIEYLDLASLVLQDLLCQKLEKKYGEKWRKIAYNEICALSQSDKKNAEHYRSLLEKFSGGSIKISRLDVTACVPFFYDFSLFETEKEEKTISKLREMRNRAFHTVDSNQSPEERAKFESSFWDESRELFKSVKELFSLSPETQNRLDDYISASSFGNVKLDTERKIADSLIMIKNGSEEEGITELEKLEELGIGQASLNLSAIYRTSMAESFGFNVEKAFYHAEKAVSAGASGSEIVYSELVKTRELIDKSKDDIDANLALAERAKKGIYLPKKWNFVFLYYKNAQRLGWTDYINTLRKETDGEFSYEALRQLTIEGDVDFVISQIEHSESTKETVFDAAMDLGQVWAVSLKILYMTEHSDNMPLQDATDLLDLCIEKDNYTEIPGNLWRMAAQSLYDIDFKKAITFDKIGAEKSNCISCTEALKEWHEKFCSVKHSLNSFVDEFWYINAIHTSEETYKIFSKNFWEDVCSEIDSYDVSKADDYIIEFFENEMNSLKVYCDSEYEYLGQDALKRLIERTELIKKENKAKELKDKYLSVVSTIKPDTDLNFWMDENQVMGYVKTVENKNKYEKILGEHSVEFWSDEKAISSALKIIETRARYCGILGERSDEFWSNMSAVKREVAIITNKREYSSLLGEKNDTFWADTSLVMSHVQAHSLKTKYASVLGNHPDAFWFDTDAVMRAVSIHQNKEKYQEILGERADSFWLDENKIASALKAKKLSDAYADILGSHNEDFWMDEDKVRNLLKIHELKTQYEGVLGEHDDSFWLNKSKVENCLMKKELKEKYSKVLGERNDEFWADEQNIKNALEGQKRKKEYHSIFGDRDDSFWESKSDVEYDLGILKSRAEKYEDILGKRELSFWNDENKVLELVREAESLKYKYKDYIRPENHLWSDKGKIKELIKERYSYAFGERDDDFWNLDGELRDYLKAYDRYMELKAKISRYSWKTGKLKLDLTDSKTKEVNPSYMYIYKFSELYDKIKNLNKPRGNSTEKASDSDKFVPYELHRLSRYKSSSTFERSKNESVKKEKTPLKFLKNLLGL